MYFSKDDNFINYTFLPELTKRKALRTMLFKHGIGASYYFPIKEQ